jgi:hypothetical protein
MPYRNSLAKASKIGRFRHGLCSIWSAVFLIPVDLGGILHIFGYRQRIEGRAGEKNRLQIVQHGSKTCTTEPTLQSIDMQYNEMQF